MPAIRDMPSVAPTSKVKNSGPSPSCIVDAVVLSHMMTMPIANSSSRTFQRTESGSATMSPRKCGPTTSPLVPTINAEDSATSRPTSVTTAQRKLLFRGVKNGVSSVATIVPMSQSSGAKARSSVQGGMNGLSITDKIIGVISGRSFRWSVELYEPILVLRFDLLGPIQEPAVIAPAPIHNHAPRFAHPFDDWIILLFHHYSPSATSLASLQ